MLMVAWMAPAIAFAVPTVSTTVPATGATAVALGQVLTVTFSEPMNPLTTVTFTVTDPTGTIPGVVSNPTSTTAIFTPDYLLAATSVPFTATITTGATAVSGNTPLASSYVWTFTTGPLAPVNLGSAANFVVLAGADVSNSPTSAITGDVGASPIAGSGITGFGGTEVTGTIYTTSAGGPAGSVPDATRLTAAKGAMTIAIGDANGRTPIPVGAHYLNPGASNLGGLNLAGGLYKFTGAAAITGSDLTLTGSANDVWIFQIGSTLTVGNGIKVTLAGGAQAANIFWSATSGAPIGTTAEMKGTILSDAAVTLNTGAKLVGRAFAFTAGITLLSNTITRPDITAPTVSSTVPVNAATGVSLNQNITATFSETMLPSSITTTTYTLTGPGTTPVAGAVTYTGTTATFDPTSALAASTLYTATITTGAKDSASNPLAGNYVWTFTTGATSDATAPTVSSTVPATAATGVSLNQNIAATFSESMLASTITTTTFTLTGPGTTPVAGAVTYTGTTATFDPTSNLAASTLFTATLTTGATDLAGNALASSYAWTFTTGATSDLTAPTVSSTVPATGATSVARSQSITATFSESMLASTITTSTFTLTGPGTTPVAGAVTTVGTTATFAPTSTLAASTLFTATITTGVQDLAGNALASNYVWTFTTVSAVDITPPTVSSTSPAPAATGVELNKRIAATFSEAMLASTITTTTFTLAGPGTTPVAGAVTYTGLTATFAPTNALTGNTSYTATITTGVKDLAGNAKTNNFAWSFTTGGAIDNTAPTVSSTDPAPGASKVARNKQIAANFSEVMLASTITDTTINVTGPGTTPVPGTVTYVGLTATFTPTSTLAANTTFTASINTKAKDLAGNALGAYAWSFTTGAAIDLTAPTVSFTATANGATGVDINSKRAATFSEAMDPLTITTETFTLAGPGGNPLLGTVTYVGRTATFTPTEALAVHTLYTVTVTTGAKDLAGNPLASDYVWSFTTGAAPDVTAPLVSSTAPTRAATSVALNQHLATVFSEPMDPLTITTQTFTVTGPLATPVLGIVTYTGLTATFHPTEALAANTPYTATIIAGANGVHDLAGNPKATNYVWSFTTGAVPDLIAPTVSSTAVADGATKVDINSKRIVTFSEEMDPGTITPTTFTLTESDGTLVPGTVVYVGRTATLTPTNALAANTLFTVTVATGVEDLAGNALASDYVWSFTTGTAPDRTIPTMTSIDPAKGATNVPLNQQIGATFSEAMDPLTLTTQTFTLAGPGTTSLLGTVSYLDRTATFSPANALAANTLFTATITTGAKDLAGNARASNFVWNFTTGSDSAAQLPAQLPVNLRSTANFALLAGSAITNVPTSAITGDIGLSPAAGSAIAGFGLTEVTGTIYAVDATYPTANVAVISPVLLATAKGDLTTAYNDAAGRTPVPAGAFLNPGAGNLGGLTLGPGLYKFAGAALISGSDLTLTGRASDVWIFQIASDLTVANGIEVVLAGGARAANIFWQVGTSATLGSTSIMQGTILADQSITLGTGATLNGRALARIAAVSLHANTVTTPHLVPTVISTTPTVKTTAERMGRRRGKYTAGTTFEQQITATFNEAMLPSTITAATFTLTGPGTTPVLGTVTYAGLTATFDPTNPLAANTVFTATITTGAKDLAGNALANNYVWSVTPGIPQVEARSIPQIFALQPNYPNPFNPSTTILYQLPVSSSVSLEIYDVLGQKVRTLIEQVQPAGFHRVMWDSRNEGGTQVAAGVYFYRLQAGDFVQVRNLLLLK